MTDVQKILSALAEAIHDGQVGEDDCTALLKALRGVPAEYHMAALMSMLGADQQEQEDKPDDYLAVKTFASCELHVGDEIIGKSGIKYVVVRINETSLDVICSACVVSRIDKSPYAVKRTGRNFPAIAAVLEEIGK